MTAPVSCVITSFNNKEQLRPAVESVLRQTLPVSEIIVSDDCSSDGSQELVRSLEREFCSVRGILRERNLGISANRDLAIRSSRHPFVTTLDGDDVFAERKIEAEWSVLSSNTDYVAYSLIAQTWLKEWWKNRILDPSETVGVLGKEFERVLDRRGTVPRDMLLSKRLYEQAGGFSHSIPLYEDWEFKLRLCRCTKQWRFSGALGTLYVQHPRGLSSTRAEEHRKWKSAIRDLHGATEEGLEDGQRRYNRWGQLKANTIYRRQLFTTLHSTGRRL